SAFGRNAPLWMEEAWKRRWPHRFFGGIGRFIAFAVSRPKRRDDEFVIGAGGPFAGTAEVEDRPIVFRPSVDAGSPSSTLGAGAAAQFTHTPEPEPGPAHEDEPEPAAE